MNNPYASFGNPVSGARFIGRSGLLREIEARLSLPRDAGNFALIGEPRIGKSSVAYQAIRCKADELRTRRKTFVWLNVGLYGSAWEFYLDLVERTFARLTDEDWVTSHLHDSVDRCRGFADLTGESQAAVMRFFANVCSANVGVIAVLDEFDAASALMARDRPGFQLLRELSYDPETSLRFLTISRRELRDIEKSSGIISNFAGICKKGYVRPFDDSELDEYFVRLESAGVTVGARLREAILGSAGSHPLFLDIMAFELIEHANQNASADAEKAQISLVMDSVPFAFVDTYKQYVDQLERDELLGKLVQILFGPVVDVTTLDIDRFTRYGTLRQSTDGYRVYSDHFLGFLRCVASTTDTWPLWRETERSLRELVGTYLAEVYGSDWLANFLKARPKYSVILRGWETSLAKERARYGDLASRDLLDYAYPDEIFSIVQTDWTWFGKVIGGDVKDWSRPFQVLARIRTPLAHNRTSAAHDGMLEEASGICKQLVARISAWRRSRDAI